MTGPTLRAQGLWTVSFDHLPFDNSAPTSVHPSSDSLLTANPQRWITMNPTTPFGATPLIPGHGMNTVHVCLIPSESHRGEVLVWDGNLTNYGTRSHQPWAIVNPYWPGLNPNEWPRPSPRPPEYRFHNATLAMPAGEGELFCAGQCWMADGRLLVAGGTKKYPIQSGAGFEGAKYVYQWDPKPQAGDPFGKWYPMPTNLEVDRWYPTVMNDGTRDHRALVVGGTNWPSPSVPWYPVNSYEVVRIVHNAQPIPRLQNYPNDFDRKNAPTPGTTFNPVASSDRQYWGSLLPTNSAAFGDYPRIHALGILDAISALGGGTAPRLFVSGFNGAGIRWAHDETQDPVFSDDIGRGPANNDPLVMYATSVLPAGPIGGIATQVHRIGGGRASIGASNLFETTNTNVTPSGWLQILPMAQPRYQGNIVLLPTGDLLAVGGQTNAGFNLVPELLVGGSTWTPMAPHAEPRDYHSAAILLPDARVFVCGGESRRSLSPNGKDYAIWEPPYFHLSYGSVPATGIRVEDAATGVKVEQDQIGPLGMAYATTYRACWTNSLEPGISISSVVLMRPAAMTHHDDGGQRMVRLVAWDDGEAVEGFQGSIVFQSPASVLHAPPGWWMLFLVNSAGRPSQAYWVHLN